MRKILNSKSQASLSQARLSQIPIAHHSELRSRRIIFIGIFLLMGFLEAGAMAVTHRTTISLTKGQTEIISTLDDQVLNAPQSVVVDARGQLIMQGGVKRNTAPSSSRTMVLVTKGICRFSTERARPGQARLRQTRQEQMREENVLSAGEMLSVEPRGSARGAGPNETVSRGPADKFLMERFLRFLGYSERARAVRTRGESPSPDERRSLNARIQRDVGLLREMNIEEYFAPGAWGARFNGHSVLEYKNLLMELRSFLNRIEVTCALVDMQRTGTGRVEAHFIFSADLITLGGRTRPGQARLGQAIITVSGAGRIEARRVGTRWIIENGELTAFEVDSNQLPAVFFKLKDLMMSS